MPTRMFAVSAAVVGAAVLATGITYAAQSESTQAAPPAKQAAASAKQAAASVKRAAPPVKQAAPEAAPLGTEGTGGRGDEGRDHEDRGHKDRDRGYGDKEEGRIHFNERTFSALTEGCVPAASGLGSTSFSIYNDSDATVEVYRGFNCDNGSPVATVGPYGATHGVATRTGHGSGQGGVFIEDGVVGSFRVIRYHDEW
ncbi:hypothetical protein [Streptomyces sp. AcE210]|uniref:hypothetical protein n=1 Tax=Streptomyces sp. AcE210 TaxID=2292703 RepID=UPI00105920F8|nr:hypothetical protein [Streptomyces sp. AcE210]